jgi:nitrilase
MDPVKVAAVQAVLYAGIDANRARAGRQQFDPVGHYSRSDVFRLVVDTTPRVAVSRQNAQQDAP